jgi:hypothetical protein
VRGEDGGNGYEVEEELGEMKRKSERGRTKEKRRESRE